MQSLPLSSCKICGKPASGRRPVYCSAECFKEYERISSRARAKQRSTFYHRAHELVYVAVNQGRLVRQPCEVCAKTLMVVAHHDDYAKPFDVRWLCRNHHMQHHRDFGPGKNA